jgi:23S rRNA pseudouridine2605 synthase
MRLNKYLSHSGIASRRKATEIIKNKQVTVNGQIIDHPAYEVKDEDVVVFNGKILKPEKNLVYILMNKPKNIITSLDDEKGRKTVMDLIKNKVKERIYPVGRLDYPTTGLLLLTNDGDLTKKLSHPSYKVPKVYEVTLDKKIIPSDIELIRKGFELEDGPVKVDWIKIVDDSGKILNLEIHMGKNRIVRRIFKHFGYEVIKLDRIYYAGLTKKGLKRGWFRHLTNKEIIMLKHFS